MQPSSLAGVSAKSVVFSPSALEDPGVTALRGALVRVLPPQAVEILALLQDRLGPPGHTVGRTPASAEGAGRAVARVLNLNGIDPAALAAFDKTTWRALADLTAQRGLVLPPGAELPEGVEIRGLPGRAYFRDHRDLHRGPGGSLKAPRALRERQVASVAQNLNASTVFPGSSESIVCRHLALDWIERRQAHLAGRRLTSQGNKSDASGSSSRFTNLQVSTPQEIQKSVLSSKEEQFDGWVRCKSKRAAVVYLSQVADFFRQQFKSMEPGQDRHFFLVSATHAMGVELRCKRNGDAGLSLVVNFYDPNRTVTSRRMVFERPDAVSLEASDLIPSEEHLSVYFGSKVPERVGVFVEVREPFALDQESPQSTLTVHRPSAATCAPAEVWLRAYWGLATGIENFMKSQVLRADEDPASNDARLDVRSDGSDCTPLLAAINSGHFSLARSMVEEVQVAARDRRLTQAGFVNFLRPLSSDGKSHVSSLGMAMAVDSAESLALTAPLLHAVISAFKVKAWTSEAVEELLSDVSVWPALTHAMDSGTCDARVTENLQALLEASKVDLFALDRLLDAEGMVSRLLSLLERVEKSRDFELAKAAFSVAEEALAKGLFDGDDYQALIRPRIDSEGVFNQVRALMLVGAPPDLLAPVVSAIVRSNLSPEAKVELLDMVFPDPTWFDVPSGRREESLEYWIDGIRMSDLDALPQAQRDALRRTRGLESDLAPYG